MDHIEGFRHYLTVAEQDRLNFHNPPELTPARFEAFLPYAVALDVENEWGAQFHNKMVRAAQAHGSSWDDLSYAPDWYSGAGKSWFQGSSSWSDVSSSFGRSILAASAAPSQVSGIKVGGSGGGFSGGGGGGGGGGGW
jgi:uncharacterized membrane protein